MKLKKPKSLSYDKYGWMFISLAVICFIIFTLYPAVESLKLSFQSFSEGSYKFTGFHNIQKMLGDKIFLKSITNNFIFLIVQVPIMLVLALFFSTLLNSMTVKFKPFFRTAIFIPCVTSLVAYSVLFKMMFANQGIINDALAIMKILRPIEWLNDPFWAKVVIIVAMTWRWTGYNMIFYLSGMQNIPRETYEGAKIDGANAFKTFWYITVPQLKPIVLLTAIMSTNGTLQLFDEPMNITAGGPANATLTMSQYIYNQSFVYSPNFGYASALSYVIVLMMVVLAMIQFKVAGDER